jgi:hypothetical protein
MKRRLLERLRKTAQSQTARFFILRPFLKSHIAVCFVKQNKNNVMQVTLIQTVTSYVTRLGAAKKKPAHLSGFFKDSIVVPN